MDQLSTIDHDLELQRILRPVVSVTIAVVFSLLLVVWFWGSLAPVTSAAIAPGVVSPDGSRKTIQHLEGGIISEIFVREGDHVEVGQWLMRLDVTQSKANFDARRGEWLRLQAMKARLEALDRKLPKLELPEFLRTEKNAEIHAFIEDQRKLFDGQQQEIENRKNVLTQQMRQLEEEIGGKRKEIDGYKKQLSIIAEEISDKRILQAKNLVRKPEVLALERAQADLEGRIGGSSADISRAEQKIEEIKLTIISVETLYRDQFSEQLTKTKRDISQIEGSVVSASDILARADVSSPVKGTVVVSRFKTIGGVVKAGESLFEITPDDDDLIIDAKLSPNDIDVVRAGLPAQVHLDPYVSRRTPMLEGKVIHVSSDVIVETGNPNIAAQRYYQVKVLIDRKEMDKAKNVVLVPGMTAEVFIITGTRTFLEYLTDPIAKSFRHAFREDYN